MVSPHGPLAADRRRGASIPALGSAGGLSSGGSVLALLAALGLTALAGTASAQDATWLATPGTNIFNTGTNWTGGTTPGSGDTAFFGTSNTTSLTFSAHTTVGGWTFNAGADNFVFTDATIPHPTFPGVNTKSIITFDGAGIVVNGGSVTIDSYTIFKNSSTAGSAIINTDSLVAFEDNSTAGSATITADTSLVRFDDTSSAGSADITITDAGSVRFYNSSTAGNATITIIERPDFYTSNLLFYDTSTAGSATIINNELVEFRGSSTGGSG